MTDTPPPNEQESVSPQDAAVADASSVSEIVLSQNEDFGLTLHLGRDLKADVLDLSIKATPPGKYVRRSTQGRVGWGNEPQYFSFNKVKKSKSLSTYVLEEARVAMRIPYNSHVEISSDDRFLSARLVWLIRPRDGFLYRNRFWIAALLILFLGSIAVGVRFFPHISDFVCARWSVCSADQVALKEVRSCAAQAKVCEQAACTSQFKSKFTASRFIPVVQKIEEEGVGRCRSSDDEKYVTVSRCVQEKINADPCSIRSCFSDYDLTQVSDRVSQAETIMAVASQRCRLSTQTAEARRQQPAPVVAQPILIDGSHQASQRYTGLRSQTDPSNCPALANFIVNVQGSNFTYSRPDFFDGASITRTWVGTIDQATGQIAILGSKGNPPTKNAMTVVGHFDNATVMSDFCGSGVFKIER